MAYTDNDSSSMMLPDQAVKEYTDAEYMKNLRFLAQQWNGQLNAIPSFGPLAASGTLTAQNYITEYFDNLSYIYGFQTPADYGFFTKDYNGNSTGIPMFRGLDARKIFDYLYGVGNALIKPLPKTAAVTAYSENAISAKKQAMDYVYFQVKNKLFLQLIQQETGFGFKAIDRDFQTAGQVDKYFESFQEGMEIAYKNMAKDVMFTNNYDIKLPKAFGYILTGNLGGMEVEYKEGRPRWDIVPPEEAIVDYSKNMDVHIEDSFGGRCFRMSIPELFSTYDFTEEEQKELKAIADNSNGAYNDLYTMWLNGFYWWRNVNNEPKVTIVKGQWRSLEFKDGEWYECLREGVLIGNKYLKENKISMGQVWRKNQKSRKRLKYVFVTPNLMMGTSVSIISMMKRIQNLKDAFITKCIQMASSAIGKAVVLNAAKLPEGLRTPDVISQLKQARVLVVEGADTDEDETNQRKLAETVDLTLDPNIGLILNLVNYFDSYIADALNLPPQVRGQLAEYQSAKVVKDIQQQATKGQSYLFENLMLWVKELVSYSVDLYKFMAPDDDMGRENLALVIGDAAVEMISMDTMRKMQFEDFLLNFDPTDYQSEQDKAELTQLAIQLASAQQPRKVLKDFLKLKKLDSTTEIINYLEAEIYKDEIREQQQMEAQMANAQANTAMNNQAQENIAAMQSETTLEKTAMDNYAKILASRQKGNSKPQ